MALLYTLVYIFLIIGHGMPFHPWLRIPDDVYYRYNVFFCAPTMILGWILSAGVVHTICRTFCPEGNFEKLLGVFGFGIGVASWATGLHDIITSFLGAVKLINQHEYEISLNSHTPWRVMLWFLMLFYATWFILLFSKGTKSVYKMSTGKSVIMGTTGFLIYQFFFFIFNR
jgi:Yip1 domain